MSGGYFEYEHHKMHEWIDKIREDKRQASEDLATLLSLVYDTLHKFDYAMSGDCSFEDFEKRFDTNLKHIDSISFRRLVLPKMNKGVECGN